MSCEIQHCFGSGSFCGAPDRFKEMLDVYFDVDKDIDAWHACIHVHRHQAGVPIVHQEICF